MTPAVDLNNFLYLFTGTHNHLVLKWTLNYLAKFRIPLQSLQLQISRLFQARSSFTLRMTITYSQIYSQKFFVFKLLSTFLNYKGVMKQNWVNYIIYQIVMYLIYWPWYSFSWFKCILNPLTYGTLLVFFSCIKFWHWQDLSKVQVALNYLRCNKHALELKSF